VHLPPLTSPLLARNQEKLRKAIAFLLKFPIKNPQPEAEGCHQGASTSSYFALVGAGSGKIEKGHGIFLYSSAISKGDLTVISSGICLSRGDRNFDLQSLVGVIEVRENWDF